MSEGAQWYVLHTYSGYENTVQASIFRVRENRHMEDVILDVNIPMETVTEIEDGKTVTKERKTYPGYVLVKMVLTDQSWQVVRNIRGVTGFVGGDSRLSGNTSPMQGTEGKERKAILATPLSEEEILALGVEKRELNLGFQLGDSVKVLDGPLEGFIGTVDELDTARNRVRVTVSMFGRETPVELELDQVEAVEH